MELSEFTGIKVTLLLNCAPFVCVAVIQCHTTSLWRSGYENLDLHMRNRMATYFRDIYICLIVKQSRKQKLSYEESVPKLDANAAMPIT